jgi:hypothetical protein
MTADGNLNGQRIEAALAKATAHGGTAATPMRTMRKAMRKARPATTSLRQICFRQIR